MSKCCAFDICLVLESTKQPEVVATEDLVKKYHRRSPPFQIEVFYVVPLFVHASRLQKTKKISKAKRFDTGSIDLQIGVTSNKIMSLISDTAEEVTHRKKSRQ